MSYWKKIVESKNKSSESQLELNLSHEKAIKEVGWNQKMQLEDRLALKEKEKIVYQYVDELWKKREVLSEKELEVLVLLTLVLDDKSFEERIDKVKKTILKK